MSFASWKLVHCQTVPAVSSPLSLLEAEDLNEFGYVVKVKENAPDLLRRALSRAPVGLVGSGR